jgi:hypothetical protein
LPKRNRTDTPARSRVPAYLLALAAAYSLVGSLSRLLGRADKDPLSRVDRAVREVREEMGRGREQTRRPQPTPEQIRTRREERRRRDAEEAPR